MKITDVRVREVSIPRIYDTYIADPAQLQPGTDHGRSRYQILELMTDLGAIGVGEVSDVASRMQPPSPAVLRDWLRESLVGTDIGTWREGWQRFAGLLPETLHPELKGLSLSGAEIALLDLVGKRYGVPLFELLGGRCREKAQVCWVAYLRGDIPLADELSRFETEIGEKLREGFCAFKLKVGEDHERDIARIRLIRRLSGRDVHLRVDASGVWQEDEAIAKLREMAAAGVEACETPVVAVNRATANDHPDLITENADAAALSLARVRRETGMALIEHVADLGDAFTAAIVRHRAVDTVNVIPSQGGGVLRARRLIHAAQTAGISALLGSTIELGPGTAASVHLAVASENVSVSSDLVSPGLLVGDVCRNRLRFDSGYLRPFDGPGLGIELDEAQMAKWAVG